LRFAPVQEKNKNHILAELEFINYLGSCQFPALKSVLANSAEELVTAETPWGEYYATVFDRVPGVKIEDTDLNNQIIYEYGKTLGKLHKLSSMFVPIRKRGSYEDVLHWIQNTLAKCQNQELGIKEGILLEEYFSKLPKTNENFGLVHYDFELDNVFYDEKTKTCNVIDFDDAMYHWYGMDIEQALDSIKEELEATQYESGCESFLSGYRSEYSVTQEEIALLPVFRRFANLYAYTRILRASEEKWHNEPDWLTGLRVKLDYFMESNSEKFGEPL